MTTRDSIVHQGRVCKVENGIVSVSFVRSSGCSGCNIRSSCGMAETSDAVVEVPARGGNFREGDTVTIYASAKNGFRAIALAYCAPFFVVVAVLIIATRLGVAEPAAGLIALAALIPYYVCLKLFGRFYRNQLSIDIKKYD